MQAGLAVYDEALTAPSSALRARWSDGTLHELPLGRWLGPPTSGDESVLGRAAGPVLDVGCGPGRHLVALHGRGVEAVGVDISRAAIAIARGRGARAVAASIFDRLPAVPTPMRTALVLDGNIGIGGDPVRLLRRIGALLAPGGRVLVELDAPGTPNVSGVLRLEGRLCSDPFPWARIAVDQVAATAGPAGYRIDETWTSERRWFAALSPRRRGC